LKARVNELIALGVDARERLGWLPPAADAPLSDLSGPPPTLRTENLRRDPTGLPRMPADNAAYLGRSLFGDYLLAVELGGALLLVATVGAIAIAFRRS
jgi:NADH-quinone oxidoreductase subunit J